MMRVHLESRKDAGVYMKPMRGNVKTLGFRMCSLLVVAGVLSGCKLDQSKEIARYRSVLDAGAPDTSALRPGEPVSLERAMLLANRHNEQLAVRGEDYIQALADKDRAFSTFLPTISIAPAFTVRDTSNRNGGSSVIVTGAGGGTVVSSGSSSNGRQTSVPLEGQINIFNGFRDVAALRRTNYTIEQRRALLLDLQSTLLLDVAQSFYTILRAEESVRVLRTSLETQGENIRFVRAQAEKGIVGPLEVSQSLADESATRVSLSQALADAENGRSTLAFLIGTDSVTGELIDQFDAPDTIEPIESLQGEAANTRQDLLAARAATDAAYANVQAAVRQYYPSITIDATYLLFNDPSSVSKWSSAIRANLPIFTAGQIEADIRTAWSQFRQLNDSLSLLSRQIQRDIKQAYQNLRTSHQKLMDLRAQVDAAQTSYNLEDQRFRRGVTSNLDRLIALDRLLTAQLQLASEHYNEKTFFLDLMRAVGRLRPETAGKLTSSWPNSPPAQSPMTQPTTRPGEPATQPG